MKHMIFRSAAAAFALILIAAALTGCASSQSAAQPNPQPDTQPSAAVPVTEPARTILPQPQTIDLANLDNCTVAVSLTEGDAYVDDTGVARMQVRVYDYDRYDLVDISQLSVGDTIVIRGQDITVSSLERDIRGEVLVNGGLEADGYTLVTDDSGVFFERLENDAHAWQELGTAVIRLSTEFLFTDSADPDKGETTYYPGDFLIPNGGIVYDFSPNNTTLTIENGQIVSMNRVYTP